jgi:hypothetical protein
MTIRTFIVTLNAQGDVGDHNLARAIEAALYKTYANPLREDAGILSVAAVPAIVQSDNPRSWRAKGE